MMIINILAGIYSLLLPGLGQILQGRCLLGFIHLAMAAFLWNAMLGWLVHLYSGIEACGYDLQPNIIWRP